MVIKTDLNNKTLLVFYTDDDETEALRKTIKTVLNDNGEVTVKDVKMYTGLTGESIDFQCKLIVDFSLTAEDLILGDTIAQEIEDTYAELVEKPIEVQYTDQ